LKKAGPGIHSIEAETSAVASTSCLWGAVLNRVSRRPEQRQGGVNDLHCRL
jgi:hypothetical protein